MAYSYAQLMSLWIQAGGSKVTAPIAAAVAMAESGGNASAINRNTNGSIDRGLWQINSIHGSKSTTDPLANAKAAVSISKKGTNWTPWVAFNTGAYKKFLNGGDTSARTSTNGPQVASQGSVGSETGGMTVDKQLGSGMFEALDVVKALGDKATWIRAGEAILGGIAIIGGVVILAQVLAVKSGATEAVGQVVGIVGPQGKIGNLVSKVKG